VEQSPAWETNRSSSSQDIPHILSSLEVNYGIHKRPTLAHILSQNNPIHASPPHVLRIHFYIISLPTPRSSKWSFSLKSPYQNHVYTSAVPICATCSVHIIKQNNYPEKVSCSVINFVAVDVLRHSVNTEAEKGCELPTM